MSVEHIKNPGLQKRPGFFMSMQFLFGIPEALLPVYDPVVFYFHTFAFEPVLHGRGRLEKLARAKLSGFVHDPMCRNALFMVTAAHCPADHSGTTFVTEICGDCSVGCRSSFRDLPYHVVNVVEKVIPLFHARLRGPVVSRRFRRKVGGTNPPRMPG